MASNPNIRVLSADSTAYKNEGTLECAAMIMEVRPGYVARKYDFIGHGYTSQLNVVTPDGEKLCEPGDWVIFNADTVETVTNKEFISKYFDLFFK